jgi:hypothetical protein
MLHATCSILVIGTSSVVVAEGWNIVAIDAVAKFGARNTGLKTLTVFLQTMALSTIASLC